MPTPPAELAGDAGERELARRAGGYHIGPGGPGGPGGPAAPCSRPRLYRRGRGPRRTSATFIYSIATDPMQSGETVEKGYLELVSRISQSVRVPVAVKLSPFFSAPANFGKRLCEAGADGLVLFNRFYQPDFDIEDREVVPSLVLSRPEELLLRLHWIAILYGHVDADLGVTGGVHSAQDVVKCITAGARVACMTSALLRNGAQHASRVLTALNNWLETSIWRR